MKIRTTQKITYKINGEPRQYLLIASEYKVLLEMLERETPQFILELTSGRDASNATEITFTQSIVKF